MVLRHCAACRALAPAGLMRLDVKIGRGGEEHHLGLGDGLLPRFRPPRVYGIDIAGDRPARFNRHVPGFGQGDHNNPAETKLTAAAAALVPKNPTFDPPGATRR